MTDLPLTIELELFEQVTAAPDTELLRVAVSLAEDEPLSTARPSLLVIDGEQVDRREPLMAPPDADDVLRAAYAVPRRRMTPETRFALEFEGGPVVDLPAPIPGRARAGSDSLPKEEAVQSPGSSRTKAELHGELAVAREQAAVAQTREIEFAALSFEAGNAAAALQAECERLAALSAIPADDSAELAAAEAARALAEARTAEAVREAEAARERSEELADGVRGLEAALRESDERAAEAQQAAAELERTNADLVSELEREHEHRAQLQKAADHARDELRMMTRERDELTRQVAAFDGVAVKARERAKEADEASAEASRSLRELEQWRGELERRLAEATTDLDSTRRARLAAEEEAHELRGRLAEAEARVELAESRSERLEARLASVEQQLAERS